MPGSFTSSASARGTSPPCRSTSARAQPIRLFVFARKKPVERMMPSTLRRARGGQRGRVGIAPEQGGRHHVHALVRALRGEDGGGRQLVGVAVVERAGGLGVRLLEDVEDLRGALRLGGAGEAPPRVVVFAFTRGIVQAASAVSVRGRLSAGKSDAWATPRRASRLRRTCTERTPAAARRAARPARAPPGARCPRRRRRGSKWSSRRTRALGRARTSTVTVPAARSNGRSRRLRAAASPSTTSSSPSRSVRRSRISAPPGSRRAARRAAIGLLVRPPPRPRSAIRRVRADERA